MYTEQLLIKIDPQTITQLKTMSEKLGLKLSTFARMILKNYVNQKPRLSDQDIQDIKVLEKYRHERGTDFNAFVQSLGFKSDEFRDNPQG